MHYISILILAILISAAGACSQTQDEHQIEHDAAVKHAHDAADVTDTRADFAGARMIVYKTPWCGCCTAWAEQAAAAGFAVELRDADNLYPIKQELGVPPAQGSCHTAEVDGYFIEGHVPFDEISRLLSERPLARGLTVPGMPLGSPGMEAEVQHTYSVNLVRADGTVEEYARYRGNEKLHGESARDRQH